MKPMKQSSANRINLGINPNDINMASQLAEMKNSSNDNLIKIAKATIGAVDSIMTTEAESNFLALNRDLQFYKQDYANKLKNPELYKDKELLELTKKEYENTIAGFDKRIGENTYMQAQLDEYTFNKNTTQQRFDDEIDFNVKKQQLIDDRAVASSMSLANTNEFFNNANQGNVAAMDRILEERSSIITTQKKLGMIDDATATADFSKLVADGHATMINTKFKNEVINNPNISIQDKIDLIDKQIDDINNEDYIQGTSKKLATFDNANVDVVANNLRSASMGASQALNSMRNALLGEQNAILKSQSMNGNGITGSENQRTIDYNSKIINLATDSEMYAVYEGYYKTIGEYPPLTRDELFSSPTHLEEFYGKDVADKIYNSHVEPGAEPYKKLNFMKNVIDPDTLKTLKAVWERPELTSEEKYQQIATNIKLQYPNSTVAAVHNLVVENKELDRVRLLNTIDKNYTGMNAAQEPIYNESVDRYNLAKKSLGMVDNLSIATIDYNLNKKNMEESRKLRAEEEIKSKAHNARLSGIPLAKINEDGSNEIFNAIVGGANVGIPKKNILNKVGLMDVKRTAEFKEFKNIIAAVYSEDTGKIAGDKEAIAAAEQAMLIADTPTFKQINYNNIITIANQMYPGKYTGKVDSVDIDSTIFKDKKVMQAALKATIRATMTKNFRIEVGHHNYNKDMNVESTVANYTMATYAPEELEPSAKKKAKIKTEPKKQYIKSKQTGAKQI